jgi:hypothetical protein
MPVRTKLPRWLTIYWNATGNANCGGKRVRKRQRRNVPRAREPNPSSPGQLWAFLNVPYDQEFETLYLAYIAALAAKGVTPRTTVEIPGGARRLDRILELIGACKYSFHDLSRVQLARSRPHAPRFNMPFEVGLTVAWERMHPHSGHVWFVFESQRNRVLKSLSDLAGTDIYGHGGTVNGVFREVANALVRTERQPSLADMAFIYRNLRAGLRRLMKQTGARTVFEAAIFKELIITAAKISLERIAKSK